MIGGSFSSSKKLEEKLKSLAVESREETLNQIIDSTLKVHAIAVKSIQQHQSSGRIYKRNGVDHSASLPGFPPNSDTGNLVRNIAFKIDAEKLEGEVGSDIEYAKFLEFGTSKMEPRPWLLPALEAVAPDYAKEMKEKLNKLYKAGGLK